MSKKGKKKGRGGKFRPPVNIPTGSIASAIKPRALAQARTGGDQATVRAVELSLGGRNVMTKARGRVIIESPDPAIPLDRVPYFTSDLVRLAVVGAAMFALLIVGALAMPVLVK